MGLCMIDTYTYWLSLLYSRELQQLEDEIKDEIERSIRPLQSTRMTHISLDEAWGLAERYTHEGF